MKKVLSHYRSIEVSERLTLPSLHKQSTLLNILANQQNSDILFFCNENRRMIICKII